MNSMDRYDFADWLQLELTKRGMSQADLARKTGLTRATVSQIINKISKPQAETLELIARALSLPSNQVFVAAGITKELPDDPLLAEMDLLFVNLSDEQKKQAVSFLRFLHQFEDEASRGK